METRHLNRRQYFDEQGITSSRHVIPYISKVKPVASHHRILEIGCGEGGNLKPFLELGCQAVGVDIKPHQIQNGSAYLKDVELAERAELICQNIYDVTADDLGQFDIVMLRDVIEHIPNQARFMDHLKQFLNPEGIVFFGFPPWHMPFGGHQQMCRTRLGKLPYIHLLPRSLYRAYLEMSGESDDTVESRLEIYDTGITIERFSRIAEDAGYRFRDRTLYLVNPNYETKFGLTPRIQYPILKDIPYLRNLWTTCCYAILERNP